jgi:hypothetical protein
MFRINRLRFKRRFGSLFESLKLKKGRWPLLYNLLLLLRRLCYALSIIFLRNYQLFQVIIHCYSSLLILIYLIRVRPFKLPLLNRIEIFNEAIILSGSYILFQIVINTKEAGKTVSWMQISLCLLQIGVNMLVIVYSFYKALRFKIRACCRKYCCSKTQKKKAKVASQSKPSTDVSTSL